MKGLLITPLTTTIITCSTVYLPPSLSSCGPLFNIENLLQLQGPLSPALFGPSVSDEVSVSNLLKHLIDSIILSLSLSFTLFLSLTHMYCIPPLQSPFSYPLSLTIIPILFVVQEGESIPAGLPPNRALWIIHR
jgi:hypothetical protein